MGYWVHLKAALVVGPILGLLLLGLFIALKSGVASLRTSQGFEFLAGNLGSLLLRVVGLGAGMLAVSRMVGNPLGLSW